MREFEGALSGPVGHLGDKDNPFHEEVLQEALNALKDFWDLPLLPVDNNSQRPFVDLWSSDIATLLRLYRGPGPIR